MQATANTWIVGDDEEVIVIDPGDDAARCSRPSATGRSSRSSARTATPGMRPRRSRSRQRDEAPVALHPADRQAWREVHDEDPEIEMEDGGMFEVAGVTLEVLHAPGHSRGSVCCTARSSRLRSPVTWSASTGPVAREDGFPNWGRQLDAIGAQVLTLPPADPAAARPRRGVHRRGRREALQLVGRRPGRTASLTSVEPASRPAADPPRA